jgi:hypothetical protein
MLSHPQSRQRTRKPAAMRIAAPIPRPRLLRHTHCPAKAFIALPVFSASPNSAPRRFLHAAAATSLICPGANQFDQFAPNHLARPVLDGAKSPAPKSQFRERIQADFGFQSWPENIAFRKSEVVVRFRHPALLRGALAIVTNVGWDAVDAAAQAARN